MVHLPATLAMRDAWTMHLIRAAVKNERQAAFVVTVLITVSPDHALNVGPAIYLLL